MTTRRSGHTETRLGAPQAQVGACVNLNSTQTLSGRINASAYGTGVPPTYTTSANAVAAGGRGYCHFHVFAMTGTATWILWGYSGMSSQWHILHKTAVTPHRSGAGEPSATLVHFHNGFTFLGASATAATAGHYGYIGG